MGELCACCSDCGTQTFHENWLNKDCCGLVCACITYLLLLFAEYVIVEEAIRPWLGSSVMGTIHATVFTVIVALGIISHFRAMTTDPGAVPLDAVPADFEPGDHGKSFRVCLKCDTYKPPRTHHCSICQRCIVKMDHHCPWVNNCVGLGNHKFFLLFLGYVFTASVYALCLLFARFLSCSDNRSGSRKSRLRGGVGVGSEPSQYVVDAAANSVESAMQAAATVAPEQQCVTSVLGGVLMLVVVVEAILFGLFTMCMMCDQWSVVLTATTQIDRLKGEQKRRRGVCENLNEVFGGEPRFSFMWLLPTAVKFNKPETVFGYRVHNKTELNMVTINDEGSSSLMFETEG
mmetsp:Transcript_16357/g.25671  ORF Transcript_16357/g.25671 Transcript_16357/m.25671 type:complete len:346 (-) Transcript_16357:1207-2244(-)